MFVRLGFSCQRAYRLDREVRSSSHTIFWWEKVPGLIGRVREIWQKWEVAEKHGNVWGQPCRDSGLPRNPPAMPETRVPSLGWEDALEKRVDNPLQYCCLGESHGQRSLTGEQPIKLQRVEHDSGTNTFTFTRAQRLSGESSACYETLRNVSLHSETQPIFLSPCFLIFIGYPEAVGSVNQR